ncbi:MAG: hypothetical protein WC965_01680 [Thiohalomonadaceae bacterium]
MQIFIVDTSSDLNVFFQKSTPNLPFLNTNLLSFMRDGFTRQASIHNEPVEVFFPDTWELDSHEKKYDGNYSEYLKDEYNLVFLLSLTTVLTGNISREDVAVLKQHPDTAYFNNGVVGGYIKGEMPTPTEDSSLFAGFWPVTEDNFLKINQELTAQLSASKAVNDNITTFGNPVILSESLWNSTICAPSFIGENVSIHNSYIGAGSVITGNTTISNSRILHSFITDSSVENVKQMEGTLVAGGSRLKGVSLSKSRVPYGSVLEGNV